MRTALVVGGSAATGRAIIDELATRGYAVTVFNRGTRNDGLSDDLEFIRGDPHFADSVRDNLVRRTWDLAVVTYGRTRVLAEELRGRVGQLVTVSGMPVVRGNPGLPLTEDDPLVCPGEAPQGLAGIAPKIAATEQVVLRGSMAGHYLGTVVRYPYVYGPHSVVPMEWHVIKRCLDGRSRWVLRDGGLALAGRCASANAAALIGTVVDHPAQASGAVYHAADERQFTEREWIESIAALMGHQFEYVDIPPAIAPLGWSCSPLAGEDPFTLSETDMSAGRIRHHLTSAQKARSELGYFEKVAPQAWIEKTVEFLLAHPPATDGSSSSMSPADFDYAAEDELLSWWDHVLSGAPVVGRAVARGHAYEHPRERQGTRPGQCKRPKGSHMDLHNAAYRHIRVEHEENLSWIVLNRPDRANALSNELLDEFSHALDALKTTGAPVLAIRGEGRGFSAGYDMGQVGMPKAADPVGDRNRLQRNLDRYLAIWDHPKPVIAAIHGYCIAGATQMCVYADITIVADDARIGEPTIPVGGGYIAPLWAPLVGPKRAKELSFVPGNYIDAETAVRWGWANHAVPAAELVDRVRSLAARIALTPADVLQVKKLSINQSMEAMGVRRAAGSVAEMDALLHTAPSVLALRERLREEGLKEVMAQYRVAPTSDLSRPKDQG